LAKIAESCDHNIDPRLNQIFFLADFESFKFLPKNGGWAKLAQPGSTPFLDALATIASSMYICTYAARRPKKHLQIGFQGTSPPESKPCSKISFKNILDVGLHVYIHGLHVFWFTFYMVLVFNGLHFYMVYSVYM
jgi:hypothetical protein